MNGKNIPIWRDRWSLQSKQQALWPVRSQLLALGNRGAIPPRVQSPGQASPLPTGHWGRPPHEQQPRDPLCHPALSIKRLASPLLCSHPSSKPH